MSNRRRTAIKSSQRKFIRYLKHTQPNICYYCGKEITEWNDLTADHKTPLSRGGRTIKENLELCCYDCNQDKGNLTKREYIKTLNKRKQELLKREADERKKKKQLEVLQEFFPCLLNTETKQL